MKFINKTKDGTEIFGLNIPKYIAFVLGLWLMFLSVFPTPDDVTIISPALQFTAGLWLVGYALGIAKTPRILS